MNLLKTIFLAICLITTTILNSQSFTELTSANLTGVSLSSVAWGDYDNDGDLDILLTGVDNFGPVTKIYRNDSGTFTEINSGIVNVSESCIDWGDYDNDGDLDILLMGRDVTLNGVSKIYRNDAGTFTDLNITLPLIYRGAAKWGDYDNDGDLDFIMMGKTGSNNFTDIYRNDSSVAFTSISSGIIGLDYGDVDWGDYDNDGDLDIAITGDINNTRYSRIYRNDNGVFTDISAGLIDLSYSSLAWGDYDSDGDLDLLLTGWGTGLNYTKLYKNNSGTFTDMNAPFVGIQHGCAEFGDFDNDGDLDVIVSGKYGSTKVSNLYENNSGTYSYVNSGFPGVEYASAAWGDYDNDGDLDILLTGVDTGPISKIFKNGSSTANTVPLAPTNLNSSVDSNYTVTLSWDKSTDAQTSQNALTYNLYLGTSPASADFISPMSILSSGYRKVVRFGNMGHSNTYVIEDLPFDTYYWSVQAIDNAFAGSTFAVEDTFEVKLDDTFIKGISNDISYRIFPNPVQDVLNIEIHEKNIQKVEVTVYNAIGNVVLYNSFEMAKFFVDTKDITMGLYYIKIEFGSNSICKKLIKI